MKTIVLDDDPTGTQSASGVRVLLEHGAELLEAALHEASAVYVQTNSRALDEAAAVALVARIREEGMTAAARLGEPVRFVLRGDSTLRGHVFAETEVLLDAEPGAIMLFVPAFPDGGRTTRDGIHLVRQGGREVPAGETEYARDPVFPFRASRLADYVREKSARPPVPVAIGEVRGGRLAGALLDAAPGSVVVPDAEDDDDIRRIAQAVREAEAAGAAIVVRSASPLAAELAGVASDGHLVLGPEDRPARVLLVCGSHTGGATAQLARLEPSLGPPLAVRTAAALRDPAAAGAEVVEPALERVRAGGVAIVASERARAAEHGTLDHGERVMRALTGAVAGILPHVDAVVAKGGITSAEVARAGMGARDARVLGQILPGISAWRMRVRDGREMLYIVVPGNVGEEDALERVLAALGLGPGLRFSSPS
ncbi:four-carbon acid sugar kinase family protein [Homoserinibacter sp. YIM 151385]|uniref:four-carbon acid sugar kinase family protein n=1 Tax=Homoserinibacter sp. YIM 151385 TaxID=2985506 RepID=UPI0022F000E8|nr:four-carbon acid sugar kinase family protein [Homoserinibacter sp. YIM 151385]WBU37483.1 four-carbon acid sugar kinase family protein [Homoserinibacter sp. YIM 151385]